MSQGVTPILEAEQHLVWARWAAATEAQENPTATIQEAEERLAKARSVAMNRRSGG